MVPSINWQNSGFQCVYIELIFELAETVTPSKTKRVVQKWVMD